MELSRPSNVLPPTPAPSWISGVIDGPNIASAPKQHNYRPDLDGLRALAVIAVIFFHFDVPGFPGGFAGVDVFFVLSGYLITRLIATAVENGTFSIVDFYDRRIRRLFPVLVVVLICSSVAALAVLSPEELARFGRTLTGAMLSFSNVVFWKKSEYFGPAADTLPLLHTWSLGIEEQFYLVFPLLFIALWRRARQRLAAVIMVATGLSFALSAWGVYRYPDATFYLLPARAWELLLGACLALPILPAPKTIAQRNIAAGAGLAAIAAATSLYSHQTPFPGLAALVPCLGSAAVIWAGLERVVAPVAASPASYGVGRLLSARPLVMIGLMSYSLYLWHWPILVFAKLCLFDQLTPGMSLALLAKIFCLSFLSWKFIEVPMRRGGRFWPRRSQRFAVTASVSGMICFVGIALVITNGLLAKQPQLDATLMHFSKDYSPLRERCHANGAGAETFEKTCSLGSADGRDIIVLADSHGAELSFALGELGERHGLRVRQMTASGCPPSVNFNTKLRPSCSVHVEKMLAALTAARPATIVVTAFFSEWNEAHRYPLFWRGFAEVVQRLRGAGHRVIIIGGTPRHPSGSLPETLARWAKFGNDPSTYTFHIDQGATSLIDERLRRLANESGGSFVPLLGYLCGAGDRCRGYQNGQALYFDDNHISLSTARRVAHDLVLPLLVSNASRIATP